MNPYFHLHQNIYFHYESNGNFFKPHELLHNSIQIFEPCSNDDHTIIPHEVPREIDSLIPHVVPHESYSIIPHQTSHESDSITLSYHHSQ